MKRIAIVTRKMIIGGIEKSLLGLLEEINFDEYEVDLYLEEEGGDLSPYLDKRVNLIYIYNDYISITKKILHELRDFNIKNCISLIQTGLILKYGVNDYLKYKARLRLTKGFHKDYDLAIAYHNPISFTTMFCIEKIKAKKKIMWVHSDINEYLDIVDRNKDYYDQYDQIFCVSERCKSTFTTRYESLADRCQVYYNHIKKSHVLSGENLQYKEEIWNSHKFRILTVSRLSNEKGVNLIPEVALLLKEEGIDFEWIVVGEGSEYAPLLKKINDYKVHDYVHLAGKQLNPYIYMVGCDIYIQPSLYEAYGLTIAEAKCFGLPIIATKTQGALEQIQDRFTGRLCEVNSESIYQVLKELISNPGEQQLYRDNLKKEEINTSNEINKLYRCIEEM
ncbi:glycosyltransferase [Turicibacter sp. KK003]|uniref:glycosyltransferase n=1 Tax=Turicibacter sp. KK003 TaxID=3114695 RepID=UPI0030D12E0C